jgi:putative oxidoreductase
MTGGMTADRRRVMALVLLRIAIAGLLAAHGWARLLTGGVEPFGGWLDSQGLPFGVVIATAVTALEILGTPLLALGRWVTWLCLAYIAVYATGLVMVHLPAGWFVVGLGRNGMEYSALLIVCLGLLAWVHAPRRAMPA